MDKVQKPSNSVYYTPSSEPFRTYNYTDCNSETPLEYVCVHTRSNWDNIEINTLGSVHKTLPCFYLRNYFENCETSRRCYSTIFGYLISCMKFLFSPVNIHRRTHRMQVESQVGLHVRVSSSVLTDFNQKWLMPRKIREARHFLIHSQVTRGQTYRRTWKSWKSYLCYISLITRKRILPYT
jgi:hypothetical protein